MVHFDVVVVGAGQAGLAATYYLQKSGLKYLLLESDAEPGGSWHRHYKSLKLLSPAQFASLPGFSFPGPQDRHPLRDEVIDYLHRYAHWLQPNIWTRAQVTDLQKERSGDKRFILILQDGRKVIANHVILAVGAFRVPYIPTLERIHDYKGQLIHSADYWEATPFTGQKVLVVGSGNTAIQLAYELSEASQVTLAARKKPQFVPQKLLGLDIHQWLTSSGLDHLPLGKWFGFSWPEPIPDSGKYKESLKNGRLRIMPMFHIFSEGGVIWPDSVQENFDSVILATGFRPDFSFLKGLNDSTSSLEFHEDGPEARTGGVSHLHPGLYYLGFPWQISHGSGTLRGVGLDAKSLVKKIQKIVVR